MVWTSVLAFFLAAIFSWALLRVFMPTLSTRLLDQPSARSSHYQPTPRGGGLAFVLVSSVASSLACLVMLHTPSPPLPLVAAPLLALPLALVGFLDDLYSLQATLRYSVQFATALCVTLLSPLVGRPFGFLALLVLMSIAITALINFTNFMDGLDGLVAGCMTVAISVAAIQLAAPWPIWALVGALLGFLFCNWCPAQVFMGDVGSTFLGAVFSVLALQASSWSEALALLLVATPLLGDACLCVLRRLMTGQHVFQAHRLHLFQRLHQAGWCHASVSSLYIAATAVLAIALLWGGLPWVIILASLELLIGVFLDQHVAVSYAEASRS